MHRIPFPLGFDVIIVRNVQARVYNLCGSDWFKNSVAKKLELIAD